MTPALSLDLRAAQQGRLAVLGALSLQVRLGETVAICGASGVGKSTLLRILAGLHADWQGDLSLTAPPAMVFQEPTLLPWRNARNNITLLTGCSDQVADQALADCGLADKAAAFPNALSLGQQRRLALARAFAMRPQILLLDEAFTSLDAKLAAEMMSLFETLRAARPLATVLVTHDPAEALRLASRTLTLSGHPARFDASPLAV